MEFRRELPREVTVQEEEKRRFAAELTEEYRRRKQRRRLLTVKWEMNRRFLLGDQYCDIAAVGDEAWLMPLNGKAVYNMIAPTIETRLSKLSRLFTRRFVFLAVTEEAEALKITARGDDSVLSRTVALPRGRSMVCLRLGVQGRLTELTIENVEGCGFELPGGMTVEFGITEG